MEIRQTKVFGEWLRAQDGAVQAKIVARIDRVRSGLHGDVRWRIDGPVSELRIDFGPGYRVYFTQRGEVLVILLCGGDKSTQKKDIKAAVKLAAEIGD